MTRVLVLGGTGTIGRATVRALLDQDHRVRCLIRRGSPPPEGAECQEGSASDPADLDRAMAGVDAVISCLASRTGAPSDAWAVDHRANLAALRAAEGAGVSHFVLLSAICVQRPRLAFQRAKLAFEAALSASALTWSIVRPTAYFKSLSGQVSRVRAGKPFLVFGDGKLTRCAPISDADLGAYLVGCLTDRDRQNRILPVGGPGPALTPREIGTALAEALGQEPRFRQIPLGLLNGIIGGLSVAGHLSPRLAEKAELARIARYYATESMLLWNPSAGRYDADATPRTGQDTLQAHFARLAAGEAP
ncbi:MAG: NAD(P)H-binding protein, partial [Pseudomonadota bacterium]